MSAFASWSATPVPLSPAEAEAAAETCRSRMSVTGDDEDGLRVLLGEGRGGWNVVILEGPSSAAACLMPDDLLGSEGPADGTSGFFGSYSADPPPAPDPASGGVVQTEYTEGSVDVPGRLGIGTDDGYSAWVMGVAGPDVARITVHPATGPEVEASLKDGRYSAWWPIDADAVERAAGGGFGYTVTLTDGTVREVDPD